jgi:adenylate kinase
MDAIVTPSPVDLSVLKGRWLFPFIAPPNGGKGTQTVRLAKLFNLPKLDMGASLREMGKQDTPLGEEIKARLNNGLLVDTPIVLEVLKSALVSMALEKPDCRAFILDGFPRNKSQVEGLLALCDHGEVQVAKAFYLKLPHHVIEQRAVNRRICPTCGKIYNLLSKPSADGTHCDDDGAVLFQREDDRLEKVCVRLKLFENETRPMIARFRENGTLVKINGDQAVQQVTTELVEAMLPYFPTLDPTTLLQLAATP